MDSNNKTKFWVKLSVGFMVVLSFVLSWIMAQNYKKDISKERHALTAAYTAAKDEGYTYDATQGKALYSQLCARCHQADGSGDYANPPLMNSPIVNGDSVKLTKVVIHGLQGAIERNGKTYNALMPAFKAIKNSELAHVLNYIKQNFGEDHSEITTMKVIEAKVDFIKRDKAWTEAEL